MVERLYLEETVGCGLVPNRAGWGEKRREGVKRIAKRLMEMRGKGGRGRGKGKGKGALVGCVGKRERVVRYDPPRAIVWGLKRYFEKLATKGGIDFRVIRSYLPKSRN